MLMDSVKSSYKEAKRNGTEMIVPTRVVISGATVKVVPVLTLRQIALFNAMLALKQ